MFDLYNFAKKNDLRVRPELQIILFELLNLKLRLNIFFVSIKFVNFDFGA